MGTTALKPYMHGYFVSLRLYDAARVITNPFAYEEHREKLVKDKVNKLSESRIRARKDTTGLPKINRALAEKIREDEERERKREERKKSRKAQKEVASTEQHEMEIEEEEGNPKTIGKSSLLKDDRFKALFENPDFQVDQASREFALLNPSTVAAVGETSQQKHMAESSDEESATSVDHDEGGDKQSGDESSDADDLVTRQNGPLAWDIERATAWRAARRPKVRMVAADPRLGGGKSKASFSRSQNASFGQRSNGRSEKTPYERNNHTSRNDKNTPMEISWVPGPQDASEEKQSRPSQRKGKEKRPGVEYFGAGMEKGGREESSGGHVNEDNRQGRTKRRTGMRSGSRSTFRKL